MTRIIAIVFLLAGCKTAQPIDSESKSTSSSNSGELTSFTCKMKNQGATGELNLKKLRLSVRKPAAGQSIDLADVEIEGTVKGSPVKYLRYCNNSSVIENPGTFVGTTVQVSLNKNKLFHWEKRSDGFIRLYDSGVSFNINSKGKLEPFRDGSLVQFDGYDLDCQEGLDADIPQMQCVSGYIPHGGPVSCAADNNTPKSQFADLCTSVGGKPIGCFGGLNSMCDIDIRQKIVLSGKFEGFDENGNQVKCENYQSGGASTCGGSFYGMVCESEGFIAFPNCKKSCGKLCSTKLSSKFP